VDDDEGDEPAVIRETGRIKGFNRT